MNSRVILKQIGSFLLFTLLQLVVFRNMHFFHLAFSFGYIGFILFLPINTGRMLVVALGFIQGLLIDTFYDTLGMHAAATTLLAFGRGLVIDLLDPGSGETNRLHPKQQGWSTFLIYVFILTAVHNLAFLTLDAYGMGFSFTLLLAMGATIALNTFLVSTLRMFV